MDTIFSVSTADIGRLDQHEAVEFFQELLWAEAWRLGVPVGGINISASIHIADGGIDASVKGAAVPPPGDLIKPGLTAYQIRTGDSFKPWQPAEIEGELFKKRKGEEEGKGKKKRQPEPKPRTADELKEGLKALMDANGTYVLVCFGHDLVGKQPQDCVNECKRQLGICGYPDAKVEVWSQNNIQGFLKNYPSLALILNNRGRDGFQTHLSWSKDRDMKTELVIGEKQEEFISSLRQDLSKHTAAVHVRVLGEPGVGKTRLILEATAAEDLSPSVCYFRSARDFKRSGLLDEILKDDNTFSCIIVVDECDRASKSEIWNMLEDRSPRIKLVSVFSEDEPPTTGPTIVLEVPRLADRAISAIISSYGIRSHDAGRWTQFCGGSPRVAHVLGGNLRDHPQDLLAEPDTVKVWDRFVADRDGLDSPAFRKRLTVLQHLALFKRFGCGKPYDKETQAIQKLIHERDHTLTQNDFVEVIKSSQRRKILQGDTTLYITPKLLHIKLWVDWWEKWGPHVAIEDLINSLPPTLLEFFFEMFRYAKESDVASGLVKDLLGTQGPFQRHDFLRSKLGGDFFLSLSEADPPAALACLKRTVGTWSREELLAWDEGRRQVVWALEKIVVWRSLFPEAARILLRLGEAENEKWSNNASGVFEKLFSPAPAPVARTEAPPEERFQILEEALASDSKERRILGLKACHEALEYTSFSRLGNPEHQGLRQDAKLWVPATYGELFDAYRRVWSLVRSKLDSLAQDEQIMATGILLDRSRELMRIEVLGNLICDTLQELSQKPYVPRKQLLTSIVSILRYRGEGLPVSVRTRLEQLRTELTGQSFSDLLRRDVGMNLVEDDYDEHGKYIGQGRKRIEGLADLVQRNHQLLEPELHWLVTKEAENGYVFGYALGKRDTGIELLPSIVAAQRSAGNNAALEFLSGYCRGLFERNPLKWEEVLDELAADERLYAAVPEVTCSSGTSDRAALRVLQLIRDGKVSLILLRNFRYGTFIDGLSEPVFVQAIELLLGTDDPKAMALAVDLHYSYFVHGHGERPLPEALTLELLTHPCFFQADENGTRHHIEEFCWSGIAEKFVEQCSTRSLELADVMLRHFGGPGSIMDGVKAYPLRVLEKILQQFPAKVWETIVRYLGPPIDGRAFHIKEWLRAGEFLGRKIGPIQYIPSELIWQWVDDDVDKRARYLATFVPKALSCEADGACLARELLVRYGDREDVRDNLMANFSSERFSGPASRHYDTKKQELLQIEVEEDNPNVRNWIEERVADLDENILSAKIREERELA